MRSRRHPALAARIVTAGVSLAATATIVAVLARANDRSEPSGPSTRSSERSVEVRVGNDVSDDEARAAIRAWLDGRPDLTDGAELTVVDAVADVESTPS